MHSDKYKQYSGRLTTGKNAASYPVMVRLVSGGIEIDAGLSMPQNQSKLLWSYKDLESSVPVTSRSSEVLITDPKQPGATLFVADPVFTANLASLSPQIGARASRMIGLKPAGSITASVAALAGLIYVTGYSPSKTIARVMPDNARTVLGQRVITSMTKKRKVCSERAGRLALDAMMNRLSTAAGLDKPFKVTVVKWNLVNAFAAPGGQLVLTSGLIRRATSADMVAGVMAHEMGHGIELHPESGLVRAVGMSAAGEFFFTGSSSTLKNIGFVLAALNYTRAAENEADQHALKILKKAGISSKPLAEFFDKMTKKSGRSGVGKVMKKYRFLSTHPPSPERAKLFGAKASYASTPVLTPEAWQSLRDICGRPPTRKERREKLKKRLLATVKTQTAILDKKPRNLNALRKRSSAYRSLKQYDKAIADLTKIIEIEPDKAKNHTRRSHIYRQLKNYEKAAVDMSAAIKLAPDKYSYYVDRARNYVGLNQIDEAIADYTHAIALAPKKIRLLLSRARLYVKQKNWDAAIWDYNTAIALKPKYYSYYILRAVAKREKGDLQEALADIDATIKLNPKNAYAYLQRGKTMAALKQDEDAIADFSKGISLRPKYILIYLERGKAYERVGDRIAAITDYRELLALKAYGKINKGAHKQARERLKALGSEE